MKIIVLCCFRDASAYLPEFIRHLSPHVDRFLFLDDRSAIPHRTFSEDLIKGMMTCKASLIQRSGRLAGDDAPFSMESRNRSILLREALAEGADWVLTLDADERVELEFLKKMRGWCLPAFDAIGFRLRDVWNSPNQYRTDGIWSEKRKTALWNVAATGALLPSEGLHGPWIRNVDDCNVVRLDASIYHLGSLTAELRTERVRRHETADPEHKWQADYSYLAKEDGLKLETIQPGRGWSEVEPVK